MEFVVNSNTIIGLAGLITAFGVIIGFIISIVKQFQKWNSYDKKIGDINTEIKDLKVEQYLQIETERAILDGLHQLKCNGEVTKAKKKLDDYVLKKAHDIEAKV